MIRPGEVRQAVRPVEFPDIVDDEVVTMSRSVGSRCWSLFTRRGHGQARGSSSCRVLESRNWFSEWG